MKVLHCCLSCFYIDGYNYQENVLARENFAAGDAVLVLASTENFDENGRLTYSPAGAYVGKDGVGVVRVRYRKWLPHALMKKVRAYPRVYQEIDRLKPDVILFHGLCAWELNTLIRYKKKNPSVKLYLDSHEDFNNSARSILSKYLLHYLFYRTIFRRAIKYADKILCISLETMDFVGKFYGCPTHKMEYFPLGGVIFDDEEYENARVATRSKYGIKSSDMIFLQSGKFDKKKKLAESLACFLQLPYDASIRYFIVGILQNEVKSEVESLILRDHRIIFLGWKEAAELTNLLCAADVYVQPGSQSATLQNSICSRCAVIVDDVPSHHPFVSENGWLVKNELALASAFKHAIEAFFEGTLERKREQSLAIARRLLDYKKMAQRLTQ